MANTMQSPLGQVQSLCDAVAWPAFRTGVLLGRLTEAWMGVGRAAVLEYGDCPAVDRPLGLCVSWDQASHLISSREHPLCSR